MQIGIGLLMLQQLSGINAVLFYSSTIFAAAGKEKKSILILDGLSVTGEILFVWFEEN